MKYILKYQIKSKYFGFTREETKEFDNKEKIYEFIVKKKITRWMIYERTNCCLFTTYSIGGKNE